jgi:pilus assembly protein Flp/PilA
MFFAKEKGQGLVEYALILVLVSIVVIVVLAILGPSISNIFQNIISAL